MIALDGAFIAGALVVGIAIGGHCAAFSGRERRREDRATRDRAICRVEDLAGQLLEAEHGMVLLAVENMRLQGDLREVWDVLEAEHLAHHQAREQSAAEILQAGRLPGWMRAAFLPRSCEVEASGNVVRFPERVA